MTIGMFTASLRKRWYLWATALLLVLAFAVGAVVPNIIVTRRLYKTAKNISEYAIGATDFFPEEAIPTAAVVQHILRNWGRFPEDLAGMTKHIDGLRARLVWLRGMSSQPDVGLASYEEKLKELLPTVTCTNGIAFCVRRFVSAAGNNYLSCVGDSLSIPCLRFLGAPLIVLTHDDYGQRWSGLYVHPFIIDQMGGMLHILPALVNVLGIRQNGEFVTNVGVAVFVLGYTHGQWYLVDIVLPTELRTNTVDLTAPPVPTQAAPQEGQKGEEEW